jgi:undecaprenyl-diphosphatase
VITDRALFLFINGLVGKAAVVDGFFRGISNDFFAIITCCLILIWLWFSERDTAMRLINQKAVLTAAISIGLANLFVVISNGLYIRPRPFNELSPDSVHLLFYRPTDPSFPSNLAAVLFALAVPIFVKNKVYGSVLLVIAILGSFGRVFMGVHYPLDVLGGAAFGALAALAAFGAMRLVSPLVKYLMDWLRNLNLA